MKKIDSFSKEYRFLSNFYSSRFAQVGLWWPTVEHFYQAYKSTNRADCLLVNGAKSADEAKKLGQEIEITAEWDSIKDEVMMLGLQLKFNSHPDLMDKLIDTSEYKLIEGNTWHDNYWGDCSCDKCKDIEGQNKLGRMLMSIRDVNTPFLNI